MKKKDIETEAPRKRGRPAGTRAREAPGLLHLTPAELIDILHNTTWTATESMKAKAVIKVLKSQDGINGKPISARVYCPAEWTGDNVLVIALTDQQAKKIQAASLRAEAAAIDTEPES